MNFKVLLGAPQSAHVLFWGCFISSNIAARFFSDILLATSALRTKQGRGRSSQGHFLTWVSSPFPPRYDLQNTCDRERGKNVCIEACLRRKHVLFALEVGALVVFEDLAKLEFRHLFRLVSSSILALRFDMFTQWTWVNSSQFHFVNF